MTYRIVCGTDMMKFEEEINRLIKCGFKPAGGICVCNEGEPAVKSEFTGDWSGGTSVFYYQAMISE